MDTTADLTIIVHDPRQSRDLKWTTVDRFMNENAARVRRPLVLERQIGRALASYRAYRAEFEDGGTLVLRRAPDLAATAPQFRARLARIGVVAGLTIEAVFALWTEYSYRSSGQSALVSEFVDWYADRLGGDRAALTAAAC